MELSAETVNAVEDWIARFEAAARQMSEAADRMQQAAQQHEGSVAMFNRAVREIPSYIRTGS